MFPEPLRLLHEVDTQYRFDKGIRKRENRERGETEKEVKNEREKVKKQFFNGECVYTNCLVLICSVDSIPNI
jgi:hypothetical protein